MRPLWKFALTPLIRSATNHLFAQGVEQSGLALVEIIINQTLKLDPVARAKLAQLDQRQIIIETRGPNFTFEVYIQDQGIQLSLPDPEQNDAPDAKIQGRCTQLLGLLLNPSLPMNGDELQLSGDIALINELDSLARNLDIDWGEPVSRIIGDSASGQLTHWVQSANAYRKICLDKVWDATEDYVQYEQHWMATGSDLEACCEQMNEARLTQARTQQRIARLNRCLSALAHA